MCKKIARAARVAVSCLVVCWLLACDSDSLVWVLLIHWVGKCFEKETKTFHHLFTFLRLVHLKQDCSLLKFHGK